ncbi:MAG: UDP-N-acetylmuramate--L-alanine ligase [Sulfurospirillaceae bacterium]|nr:UDP-N-acetylmuramate--L-alanine ligase [Sulfurospirillaceae bacterium]
MKKVHFVGIGGIGLSALARFLKEKGYTVTGSDIRATKITSALEQEGIEIQIPHSSQCIKDQDLVVYSAAIKGENVELIEAKKKGIATFSRKEALLFILKDKRVFSVCGAHGKSTTSAMLASLIDGTVIIGAESKQFGTNMYFRDGDNVIFEADESDESFLNSNPYIAIVTNAEPEHMEYYNYDYERFYGAYKHFLQSATLRVINAEDEFLGTLESLEAIRLYPSRDIKDIQTVMRDNEPFTSFVLKDLGRFEVWGIGEHMAIDASLAILAALNEMDVELIREKLKNFKGIKKRFDILHVEKNFALIDDYGHHPTEIRATIESVKKYSQLMGFSKITAIWQPHKYSRTIDNLEAFVGCFEGVDRLIILPVWKVGEKEIEIDFKKEFARYNLMLVDCVKRSESSIEAIKDAKSCAKLDDGLVIGFGAGDLSYQLRGII